MASDLERRLGGLKLSEAESSVLKGSWKKKGGESEGDLQAVGKLFSEKPGNAEGIVNAVGNIWCPRRGIRCRDLGDNLFLFTFLQPAGRRRAIEDGPWEFGGDLLIVREFDENCLLEELEFAFTPIWLRVFKLPIGLMTIETGQEIGDRVGKTIEVDTDEGGSAIGKFLRIKVLFDIRKPLLRGVTMEIGPNGITQWCPIQYEFLPNFCYICGRLGHIDRECPTGNWTEKKKPFGPELRVCPSRRRGLEDGRGRSRSSGSAGTKSEGNSIVPGKSNLKGGFVKEAGKGVTGSVELEEESNSLSKMLTKTQVAGVAKKLSWEDVSSGSERGKEVSVSLRENEVNGMKEKLLQQDENRVAVGRSGTEQENIRHISVQVDGDLIVEDVENIGEMEVDETRVPDPQFYAGTKEDAGSVGTVSVQQSEGRNFANGNDLGENKSQNINNKKQRTFKRVKRKSNGTIKEAKNRGYRKRSLEEKRSGVNSLKKQRIETIWRDAEGDVAVVETDTFVEPARLIGQPRLEK